jgi:aerobic carbon-monoxide dehydrogenase large subunit
MADGPTYRAVFIRMHPTGKAVLSLSEASQGEEAKLAGVAAAELGIPPEDIKVVHEDADRFGEGNTFNTEPSEAVGENVAITARKLRDKAQIVAASMLGAAPAALRFDNGRWTAEQGDPKGVRVQEVALHTFGSVELPEGIEGSLDAQTTYRVGAVQATG